MTDSAKAQADRPKGIPPASKHSQKWRPVIDDMLSWVKSVLYTQLIDPGDCICELFCGTGAELKRWVKVPLGYYVGVDKSEANIREAQGRFDKQADRPASLRLPSFPIEFVQGDPLGGCCFHGAAEAPQGASDSHSRGLFDSVTCHNSSLPLAFKDEESLAGLLRTVTANLRPGGLFYGTMPDPGTIWYRAQKSNKSPPAFKGEGYEVVFDRANEPFAFYGTPYQMRLLGENNSTKAEAGFRRERYFMVHIPTLRRVAASFGLQTVDMPNMVAFYEDYCHVFSSQLKAMYPRLERHGSIPTSHTHLISLHAVFVFRFKPATSLPRPMPPAAVCSTAPSDGEVQIVEPPAAAPVESAEVDMDVSDDAEEEGELPEEAEDGEVEGGSSKKRKLDEDDDL